MNAKRHARVAIALASCALITAPAAQAVLQSEGGTYSQPRGDDHARATPASVVAPFIGTGDDHARTDRGTVAVSVPSTPPRPSPPRRVASTGRTPASASGPPQESPSSRPVP